MVASEMFATVSNFGDMYQLDWKFRACFPLFMFAFFVLFYVTFVEEVLEAKAYIFLSNLYIYQWGGIEWIKYSEKESRERT